MIANWKVVTLLLILGALCLSVTVAWWGFRGGNGPTLSRWRRLLFRCGLVGNVVSLVLLLSFIVHAQLIWYGVTKAMDLDRAYPVLSFIVVSLLTVVCGMFGRRTPRLLVILNGVALTILWYEFALAFSV